MEELAQVRGFQQCTDKQQRMRDMQIKDSECDNETDRQTDVWTDVWMDELMDRRME